MKEIKKWLLGCCVLVISMVTHAENIFNNIDIDADKVEYNLPAGLIIYKGNIKVVHGISTIWADRLIAVIKNNTVQRLEATGKPVKFQYLADKPVYGHGRKSIYKVIDKTISIIGDAEIKQGDNIVKGSKIIYNMNKEFIRGENVRMKFLPE